MRFWGHPGGGSFRSCIGVTCVSSRPNIRVEVVIATQRDPLRELERPGVKGGRYFTFLSHVHFYSLGTFTCNKKDRWEEGGSVVRPELGYNY